MAFRDRNTTSRSLNLLKKADIDEANDSIRINSIFLSYARDDDELFVKRLYNDLVARGFEVWWDRVSMPSRQLTFYQEIRDAIMSRDRVVLVVGPHAVTSDYVTQEWQWALEMGKCINPIIRLDGRQNDGGLIEGYELLPEQLKLVPAEDFRDDSRYREHLENLVLQFSDPVPPLGKLIAVPTLPVHYRAQPERLRQLRDVLLADLLGPFVITGAVARVGVQGMGGIGKSVLAAALARDPEVRRAFPDGIFWIGIGQHPNLVDLQRHTVKNLGGDSVFDDIHTGKARLRELLEHRAVLFILDDVWQVHDADAFDAVGLGSKLLLTTRDAGLATSFTGTPYPVQLPSISEARALIATAARISVDALPPIAGEIIDECGRLPLALVLCGSMTSKGQTWERILRMLREARLELIADRHSIDETHRNIWQAMEVSVNVLNPDEQRRFIELAVFSFDTVVPEEAVFTLWHYTGELDDLAAADLLMSFYERSLVLIDRPPGSGSTGTVRVSLHDLLFDFTTRKAIQSFKNIAVLHNQLIEAYRGRCLEGWPSVPDDGYILQYLCHHLSAAGRLDQVGSLLVNFAWIERKVESSLLNSLVADYDLITDPSIPGYGVSDCPSLPINDKNSFKHIQGALRLSAHVIAKKPNQLPSQLVGRLLGFKDPVVRTFIDRLNRFDRYPWLRPITRSLTPPGGPLIKTLVGHTGSVRSVAVTPDGSWAVSGSRDRTLKVWDLERGSEIHTLAGHTSSVVSVAVTPDCRRAVSGSGDGDMKVWDLESGSEIHVLNGHTGPIWSVAVISDSHRAISGSGDKTLKVWDLESGVEIPNPAGHTQFVSSVSVMPDDRRVVSGSWDHTLKIWDLESGEEIHTLRGHTGSVVSVAVTPDGRRVVSGSRDHTLKIWDLESGDAIHTFVGHTGPVRSVAVTPDGRRVVSGSRDHTLKIWDLESGDAIHTFVGHRDSVESVAVTPDGRRVVSGSWDHTLKIWDLESGNEVHTLKGHTDSVWSVAVTPENRYLVLDSRDATIKVWDLESGTFITEFYCEGPISAIGCKNFPFSIIAGDIIGRICILRLEGMIPDSGGRR
jgi:WD40 repeat protein